MKLGEVKGGGKESGSERSERGRGGGRESGK